MGVRQRRHAKCAVLGRLQELVWDPWGELIDFAGFSLSNYRYDINRCLAEKAVARSLTAFCQHILMISVHVGVRYLLLCRYFFSLSCHDQSQVKNNSKTCCMTPAFSSIPSAIFKCKNMSCANRHRSMVKCHTE